MNRKFLLVAALASAALLSPCATAQDLARFLPKDAQILLVADGPARLGERFAATNVGRMLASPEAEPIRELPRTLVGLLAKSATEAEVPLDIRALADRLGAYGGRWGIGAHVDVGKYVDDQELEFLVAMVFEPHASVNLGEVATELETAVVESGATLEALDAGPGFRVQITADGIGVTVPRVVDGHLVMFIASDAVATLGKAFDSDEILGAALPQEVAGQGLFLRVAPSLFRMAIAAEARRDTNPFSRVSRESTTRTLTAVFDRLALEWLEVSIAPSDEFVHTSFELTAEAARPNLIDVFQPREKSTPLAALAPRQHASWLAMRLDLKEVLQIVFDVVRDLEMTDDPRGEIEQALQAMAGIDLYADLLEPLDGQLVLLNDSLASFEAMQGEDEPEEIPGMYSALLGMRDPATFEAGLEKLLRSRGLHAARKTAEYRGASVRTVPAIIAELHYAFVAEGLALGLGKIGADNVRRMIDLSLAKSEGQAPEPFNDRLKARFATLSGDWRDLGADDSQSSSSALADAVALAFADMGDLDDPAAEAFLEAFQSAVWTWLELAPRFDLLSSVTASRVEPGRWRAVQVF